MQNTQPQNNQPNLNEQASTQKVSKNWLYASILLGIVLLLAFLSGKLQAISIKGVFILVGGYIGYLFFNKWLEMMKEPSLEKFVKLCNEYNKKHNGGFLDDRLYNIYCDELGKDKFQISFIQEKIHFIIFRNKIIGKPYTNISEGREDINKSKIAEYLAKNGVTDNILVD